MRLTPRNVELLRALSDPSAKPDDYVFENTLGGPIDQRSFYKLFRAAQRRLGIRLRDLTQARILTCPAHSPAGSI